MTHLFSIPNKEKNYQSYAVYVMAVIWTVVITAIVSVGFYFFPAIWLRYLTIIGESLAMVAIILTINHFGRTRLASWMLAIMLWFIITVPCYTAGGMTAPGILTQTSVILTAGFLIGWRGGLIIGVLTIGTDFVFAYLEVENLLPVSTVKHTPITRWIGAIIPFGTILTLQYYFTNQIQSSVITMQREIRKREEAEKQKDETVYNLGERVKELKTLYAVSILLQNEHASFEQLFSEIANVLPPGWQYPDITAARICVAGKEYTSPNYKPSEYSLQAEMKTFTGTKIGIEIVYLQSMPECDEGPFLKEERSLINMLVEMLKIDLDRRERIIELKDYKYALDIASLVSITGADDTFTFVNDNFCKASKYTAQELLGQHWSMLDSGLHSAEYFADLAVALQHKKSYRGEFCNKAKDGTLYWVDTTIIPFLDENGKVYQILTINHDITEQKKATELFRHQFENSPDTILIINRDLKIETINYVSDASGLTPADYVGMDSIEVLPEESRALSRETATRCFTNGKMIQIENEISGHRWMRSRFVPMLIDGHINNIMVIATDITKQREAEEKLRQSEEKNRALIENIDDAIVLIDENENLVYQSRAAERISNFLPEDTYGKKSSSFIHQEDEQEFRTLLQKALNAPGEPFHAQFRIKHKKGHTIWAEGTLVNMIHNKSIKGIVVNYRDITERKESEEKIKQNEQLLKKITSQVPGNTYMFEIDEDGKTNIIFSNRGTDGLLSKNVEIEYHSASFDEVIHDEDKTKFNHAMKEGYQTLSPMSFQYRTIVNGQIRWRWMHAVSEKDVNGKILWYGATSDITPLVDYIGSIEQIIFDIGHVIRRPIATMMGMTTLLKDYDLSESEIKSMSRKLFFISEEMDRFIHELNSIYNQKRQNAKLNIDVASLIDKRSSLFN